MTTQMKSIVVPDGTVILDTSGKITPQRVAAIKAWRHPGTGTPAEGIIRYVSLYQVNLVGDIDPNEASLILDNFQYFGLVQHCLKAPPGKTGWFASPQLGQMKGMTAKKHADAVGYPGDSMIGYDDEDVEGGDIAGEIGQWATAIASRPPLLYVGYAAGLNSSQLWHLPTIHAYWSDAGHRAVDHCGVMLQQELQVNIGGMFFDPNVANADQLGRRAVFATAA